jgi:hypothetical protein
MPDPVTLTDAPRPVGTAERDPARLTGAGRVDTVDTAVFAPEPSLTTGVFGSGLLISFGLCTC